MVVVESRFIKACFCLLGMANGVVGIHVLNRGSKGLILSEVRLFRKEKIATLLV